MFVVRTPGINGGEKTKGCEKAGIEILKFLNQISSNEKGIPINTALLDLEEIHLDNSNLKLTNELIYKNALKTFDIKPKTIFLGGDHSISYSLTKAFLKHCKEEKKEPCLIVFDSLPNLIGEENEKNEKKREEEKKEEKKSGGDDNGKNKEERVEGEKGYPTNMQWLRKLIEEGFPKENILMVGVREFEKEEIDFITKNKIKIIPPNQILEDILDSADIITEFSNGRDLYVSIDISVIDPVFASATDYKKSGGLSPREFLYIINRVNKIKNFKAVDIVEINPKLDKDFSTIRLGAKILSELASP